VELVKRKRTQVSRDFAASVRSVRVTENFGRGQAFAAGAVLFALAFVAYLPALRAGFIWDDDTHLTANRTVIGPLGLREIWTTPAANYFPLVLTAFRAIHGLVGLNPLPYHLVSLVFHAFNTLLLWRVLRRLDISAAWLGAALWAVHPVQVESVAWISELKNTQSCLCYLSACYFFLNWLDADRGSRAAWHWYAAALVAATLAILSKPSTVMLPVALGLGWWWRERIWRWRNLATLAPFFALSLAAAAWTIWEQKFHSGALGADWAQTWPERCIIAGRAIWFYLGKLLWPHPLIFVYPRWQFAATDVLAYVPFIAAPALFLVLWRREQTAARATFFALGYFVTLLFPVLGFFNVYYFRYSFVADHFQYLASMAPLALAAVAMAQIARLLPAPLHWLKPIGMAALLGGLAALTWQQTGNYRDGPTLYKTILAQNPSCWLAHNNLAQILTDEGKLDEAMEHCRVSLRLHPTAVAEFNLGFALMEKGEATEAIVHYRAAVALDPALVEASNNLGVLLASLGRAGEAIDVYAQALQAEPNSAATHANWGLLLVARGETNAAVEHYRAALAIDPASATTHDYLGVALVRLHRYDEALASFRRSTEVDPNYFSARHHLGQVLALQGRIDEAIEAYEVALRLRPDAPEVRTHLGNALAQKGRTIEAAAEFTEALRLRPDYTEAQRQLQLLSTRPPLAENTPAP
jgi:protein O-mannosyl-transferase